MFKHLFYNVQQKISLQCFSRFQEILKPFFFNSTTVLTNYNDLPPADLALCQDTGRRILFSYSLEMFRDLFFVYQQTCMYRIKNKQKNLFYLYMLNKHANMYKTHMCMRGLKRPLACVVGPWQKSVSLCGRWGGFRILKMILYFTSFYICL